MTRSSCLAKVAFVLLSSLTLLPSASMAQEEGRPRPEVERRRDDVEERRRLEEERRRPEERVTRAEEVGRDKDLTQRTNKEFHDADALETKIEAQKQHEESPSRKSDATASKYGTTPEGRPFTEHYGTETGPDRNIPGSVIDHTINTTKGVPAEDGKTVYYDENNNITVVTGNGGSIVSARKGLPRSGQ